MLVATGGKLGLQVLDLDAVVMYLGAQLPPQFLLSLQLILESVDLLLLHREILIANGTCELSC